MSILSTKLASAFVTGAVVGAAFAALPDRAAFAADSCLTEPKGEAAPGKRWYYHLERGTGRHCWYLRAEDAKIAGTDNRDAETAAKPALRRPAANRPSVADAHAELRPPSADGTTSVWPSPAAPSPAPSDNGAATNTSDDAPTSSLASRWSPAGAVAQADALAASGKMAAPEASPIVAEANDGANAAPAAVSPPPSSMGAAIERNMGSVQKLFVVAIGALALAGVTGSAVYRFGRRRRTQWLRERTNWQTEDDAGLPPWAEYAPMRHEPVLDDLDEPDALTAETASTHPFDESDLADAPVEKIEDFLARLTAQLRAETEDQRHTEHGVEAST